ncbi:fibroblast growth factor receptor 4-like isoform X2 [Physella acuta]|nr:fibroblast growth factor receptor 4-like isoform X2 [Physella acuta]
MDCSLCWDACFNLMSSASLVNSTCDNSQHKGVKVACDFVQRKPKGPSLHGTWKFPENVSVVLTQAMLTMSWKPPVLVSGPNETGSSDDVTRPRPLVYVLLSRNKNEKDVQYATFEQLVSTKLISSSDNVPLTPEFILEAVSEGGVIARVEVTPEPLFVAEFVMSPSEDYENLLASDSATWYVEKENGINASMKLDTEVVTAEDGSYVGMTGLVTFRGPEWLNGHDTHAYVMYWFMFDCDNAYDYVPRCNVARFYRGSTVYGKTADTITYLIKNLYFNAVYKLIIVYHNDSRIISELAFKTEPCEKPDVMRWTRCMDSIKEDERPNVLIKGPGPVDTEDERLYLNITSMTIDESNDHVRVNVTWVPINQSGTTYNVTTLVQGETTLVVERVVTPQPYIVLSLQQDTHYLVKVEAVLKPQPGVVPEPSHLAGTLKFNTSDVNLAIYQEPVAFRLQNVDDIRQVNGIIIAVSCVIAVFVLVILAAILYKKRKSLTDIIVTKATVAKSNSYKSNVGGKSDYSNQLIVFSDEWELDPLKLKFSTLLGQGAFGKVVTGYFEDQKVAIKLVREGAPMSYKEDLVAEIHLMKRIGNHPNIVCLIGACTMSEPIALVMEYVPYGNLQNFLKKCRLDGDLIKRTDGTCEITYTMIQDGGDLENGVVTPADMLSFARQVSMAMEYLTEKKYVHRDLAARNVLLDYNKVVKVCDFGLSRDIFNDNHYKKLTNGKLPLKWMAIESLRDRIFTTQSDVWSFGILLWEIVTMGASPYPNVALADLYYVLSTGYRMDKPSNCSDELYAIMRSCWEDEPLERPNFTQLRFMLEELLTEDRNYLVLEDIDVPLTNSDNSSSPTPPPGSDTDLSSVITDGASAGPRFSPPDSPPPAANPSHPVKLMKKASPRRDNMRINVCIHQKSTDRLIRPSESDSSPSSC